ncbi:MAG: FAD-binding protein [Aureispira sp.]|nr:FAD-binding protein [Aureispira sp.]
MAKVKKVIKKMKGEMKTYYSYGNVYESTAEIFYPKTVVELRELLLFCKENNRKITVAGSFNSFDKQNSGNDVVISLQKFNSIKYNNSNHTITVGSGVSWGTIFDVVYENKCALFTCITGVKPTAGGTLSVNSNSVWTPGNGKEGNHCLEIEVMTTEGQVLTCSRTENSDLFYGVVGGLGFLGFIIKITYQVFYVGSHYEIKIDVVDYDDINELEKRLPLRKSKQFNTLEDLKSQSTLFYFDAKQPKFCVYNRTYKTVKKHKKSSKLASGLATIASGVIRFYPALASLAVKKDTNKKSNKRLLIKNLTAPKYGLFWAQPDYNWSKQFSKFFQKLGYEPKLYQNSYFIPEGEEKVTLFTKKVYDLIEKKRISLLYV